MMDTAFLNDSNNESIEVSSNNTRVTMFEKKTILLRRWKKMNFRWINKYEKKVYPPYISREKQ